MKCMLSSPIPFLASCFLLLASRLWLYRISAYFKQANLFPTLLNLLRLFPSPLKKKNLAIEKATKGERRNEKKGARRGCKQGSEREGKDKRIEVGGQKQRLLVSTGC